MNGRGRPRLTASVFALGLLALLLDAASGPGWGASPSVTARAMPEGPLSMGPLRELLAGALGALVPDGQQGLAIGVLGALLGAATLAGVVAAAHALLPRDPATGVIGALLLLLAPPFRHAAALASPEVLAATGLAWSVALAARYQRTSSAHARAETTTTGERTRDHVAGSASDHVAGSASDHTAGLASDHAAGPASDHTAGPASDHTAGLASDHVAGSASDHTAGLASDHTAGLASDHAAGLASDHAAGLASDHAAGLASDHTVGPASDHTAGNATAVGAVLACGVVVDGAPWLGAASALAIAAWLVRAGAPRARVAALSAAIALASATLWLAMGAALPGLATPAGAALAAAGRGAAAVVIGAGALGGAFGVATGLPRARGVAMVAAIALVHEALVGGASSAALAVLAVGAAVIPGALVHAASATTTGLARHALALVAGAPLVGVAAITGATSDVGAPGADYARHATNSADAPASAHPLSSPAAEQALALTLARARREVASGTLDAAARTAGLEERFGPDGLAVLGAATRSSLRPSLFELLPLDGTPIGPWTIDVFGDDLAWLAGLPLPPLDASAPAPRRLHALWRALLAGERSPDDPELAALGPDAMRATRALLERSSAATQPAVRAAP